MINCGLMTSALLQCAVRWQSRDIKNNFQIFPLSFPVSVFSYRCHVTLLRVLWNYDAKGSASVAWWVLIHFSECQKNDQERTTGNNTLFCFVCLFVYQFVYQFVCHGCQKCCCGKCTLFQSKKNIRQNATCNALLNFGRKKFLDDNNDFLILQFWAVSQPRFLAYWKYAAFLFVVVLFCFWRGGV